MAEAGLGLIAYVGDSVILDGSGSFDPEGDTLAYTWVQVGGPPVTIDRADTPQPVFVIEAPGTLRFALVVNDGLTDSPADDVAIVVPYEVIEGVEAGCSAVGGVGSVFGVAFGLALVSRRRR